MPSTPRPDFSEWGSTHLDEHVDSPVTVSDSSTQAIPWASVVLLFQYVKEHANTASSAYQQLTSLSNATERTPEHSMFSDATFLDLDDYTVTYVKRLHTFAVVDSNGSYMKWDAVRSLVHAAIHAPGASASQLHALNIVKHHTGTDDSDKTRRRVQFTEELFTPNQGTQPHNSSTDLQTDPVDKQSGDRDTPPAATDMHAMAQAMASAVSAAMAQKTLTPAITLRTLRPTEAVHPLTRRDWIREAHRALEDTPVEQQGHRATKFLHLDVQSLLLATFETPDANGLFPRHLTLSDLADMFDKAYPGSDVDNAALSQLDSLTCTSQAGWANYVMLLKNLCYRYPDSVGHRSDLDMRRHLMRNLNSFNAQLHESLTLKMALNELSFTTWRKVADHISTRLAAVAAVKAQIAAMQTPVVTQIPVVPRTPHPHPRDRDDRDRRIQHDYRTRETRRKTHHQYQPRSRDGHPHNAQPVQLHSLRSNTALTSEGKCSFCKSTSHIASAEQCSEVAKHISDGGEWCAQCQMTNHTDKTCGHQHPEHKEKSRYVIHKNLRDSEVSKLSRQLQSVRGKLNAIKAAAVTAKDTRSDHTPQVPIPHAPVQGYPTHLYSMQQHQLQAQHAAPPTQYVPPYLPPQPQAAVPLPLGPPPSHTVNEHRERMEFHRLMTKYQTTTPVPQ